MKAQDWSVDHTHLLCFLWFCLNHNPLKLLPNSLSENLRFMPLVYVLAAQYSNVLFPDPHIVHTLYTDHLDIILIFSFFCQVFQTE